ncbi:BAG family molecular chaperone regulator 4 [Daucus carota subsp. sativus]
MSSRDSIMKIKVLHGINWLDFSVPPNTTFGDLKAIIAEQIGMAPNVQRLFFKGIEERDQECLEIAGLKNNSKLLLRKSARNDRVEEVPASDDEIEVVKVTQKSKGSELVAEVKVDNDKLAAQVGALRKVICEGHKVFHKDLNILVEMLERQLLKLDGIKAEGEGKLQRKMEVRRVQGLLETADDLKRRNSVLIARSTESVADTTKCMPMFWPKFR